MILHGLGAGYLGGRSGLGSEYVPNGQAMFPPDFGHSSNNVPSSSSANAGQSANNNVTRGDSKSNQNIGINSMANQWYQPPQPAYNYVASSSSRETRNRAEKQRRDRLNSFISELSQLVPLVSRSSKRMDKTSILRLTATHLRIYQTLIKGKGAPQMALPPYVDQFVLEQLICDQMGGFLLIMCPSGKIIFVSHGVEALLGHLQTDLMGQSLFSVTASEDHDTLRLYLGSEGEIEQGWRKYFNIQLKRAGPKSESPQFESVRMMGVHRQMSEGGESSTNGNSSPISSSASTSSLQTSFNTDILVFFVKLCRPQPLVDRLVAASKDEYVTRHLIDGRIIACDQRISLIAGYMTDEVQGHNAFQYMHKDDMRFAMVALRQMYDKGESRGNSCYRLKSSNGQFIYLKTFGFLEIDGQGIVESFICVNVLVDEKEGVHHMSEMKRRYSALFNSSLASLPYDSGSEQTTVMISELMSPPSKVPAIETSKVDQTEDPAAVEEAVNELMQNLPSPGSEEVVESNGQPKEVPTNGVEPSIDKSTPEFTVAHQVKPHLRIKPSGKRAPSLSPDHVKRQRLNSVDTEPPQLSPSIELTPMAYPKGPHVGKMPKLEEQQYPPADIMRHQHHHHHAA